MWTEVTRKWRDLTGSHLEVAVQGGKLANTVHFTSYKAVARMSRQSRDGKWRHMTLGDQKLSGSDVIWLEVTWNSLEKAENWHILYISFLQDLARRRHSRHRKWRHVTPADWKWLGGTSFDRKSPGSGCSRQETRVYCTFHFLQGSSSQEEAVTWQEMTSRDLRWPVVPWKLCHLIGSHLEVAVEGRKLAYTVHFTSYKAVARRRQSRDRKWRQVTSGGRKWPESDVIWPVVTWKCCRRPKTGVHYTFHSIQGCNSQQEAVTWQEMTSRGPRWLEVTRKWRHLRGSHQEVAVDGRKLAYTVHFTSYKAVARRGRQSRKRKWRHVTPDDRT